MVCVCVFVFCTPFLKSEPHSCKNWKAGLLRSSSAVLTSTKSLSCIDPDISSTENGMLHRNYPNWVCYHRFLHFRGI